MEFAHTPDDGLTCFMVDFDLKCWIFLRKSLQSSAHFFLISLGFGLNGKRYNRFWKCNFFQNNGIILVTKSITCTCIFETNYCYNFTGISLFNLLTIVGVHKKKTS